MTPRFDPDASDFAGARRYLRERSCQLLASGYRTLLLEPEILRSDDVEWGCRMLFSSTDDEVFQSIYVYAQHRGQGHMSRYLREESLPILTMQDCAIEGFLRKIDARYVLADGATQLPEYRAIAEFYGGRCARRSQVPLMHHIDEGLAVLRWIKASTNAERAYCLHPLLQADFQLAETYQRPSLVTESVSGFLAMEYRNIANRTLLDRVGKLRSPNDIPLSPLQEVNQMLVADKVQNYKDFLLHHGSTHPRRRDLDRYFRLWLERLGVNRDQFRGFFERLQTTPYPQPIPATAL